MLPRGVPGGGVAKALRDEQMATAAMLTTLKGQGWEDREDHDPPPHMATIAGLQSYGRDVLDDDTYRVSSYLTTHAQAKDGRKGNTSEQKAPPDPKTPALGAQRPQVPQMAPRRQVPQVQPLPASTPSSPQPHPANMEDAWQQCKNVPKPIPTGEAPGKE